MSVCYNKNGKLFYIHHVKVINKKDLIFNKKVDKRLDIRNFSLHICTRKKITIIYCKYLTLRLNQNRHPTTTAKPCTSPESPL